MTPNELKYRYSQGENIISLLRKDIDSEQNHQKMIEISYDLQAGSYIEGMKHADMSKHKSEYTEEIVQTILSLCEPNSILEAGVGEATTLSGVLTKLDHSIKSYGFDLSWSRVVYAKRWMDFQGVSNCSFCTGDLYNIPFQDNSVDVVFTSHAIEPNGGGEAAILSELYRVAKKYLILFEPGYELANKQARNRMDSHGYCKNLPSIAESLGFNVNRHELIHSIYNPLNPTALTIISKCSDNDSSSTYACPIYKTPLLEIKGAMYSEEALVAYPILGGVPCLKPENGIVASKYKEVFVDGTCESF